MRPVRHFSRALHQVSVCARKSARHSQVRSPNMRTSQHIVAVSVRVVHIAPVSRGLHGQMRRVGTTCKPQRRASLGKIMQQICHGRRAAQRLTRLNQIRKAFLKRLFFFSRCRDEQQSKTTTAATTTTTKVLAQRARGSRETLFSFLFIHLFHLFY